MDRKRQEKQMVHFLLTKPSEERKREVSDRQRSKASRKSSVEKPSTGMITLENLNPKSKDAHVKQ